MKLLVVEDDAKIGRAVARALTAEGFTIDRAHDGDDAIWMANEGDYGVVLLDLMLPRRDGFRVCEELRAAGNWTAVLVLTARDDESAETRALDAGADDFLTKPYSLPVLVAHIRSLLRRTEHRGTPHVEVGDLRIDPTSRRAWSHDQEIRLTNREFNILEFLMRRRGAAVAKQDILRGVWEFDYDGSENIVQVYVTRLRRKLDEPFGSNHIRTVHGVGYRLEGDVA